MGPAQAESEENNFFKNIVLKTTQKFSKNVPKSNKVKSQTVIAKVQWVLASKKTWNKTIIAYDLNGQAGYVFIAREILSQSNKIDIDPD